MSSDIADSPRNLRTIARRRQDERLLWPSRGISSSSVCAWYTAQQITKQTYVPRTCARYEFTFQIRPTYTGVQIRQRKKPFFIATPRKLFLCSSSSSSSPGHRKKQLERRKKRVRRLAFSSRASWFFLAATAEWRGTRKLRRETGWIGRESLETCQWGPRDQNKYINAQKSKSLALPKASKPSLQFYFSTYELWVEINIFSLGGGGGNQTFIF